MNTLLEGIKKYPEIFSSVFKMRSETTPSAYNKEKHSLLAEKVKEGDWITVSKVIQERQYFRGLIGVVECLNMYDYDEDFTFENHNLMLNLLKEGSLC